MIIEQQYMIYILTTNTVPAGALTTLQASASAGMVLTPKPGVFRLRHRNLKRVWNNDGELTKEMGEYKHTYYYEDAITHPCRKNSSRQLLSQIAGKLFASIIMKIMYGSMLYAKSMT